MRVSIVADEDRHVERLRSQLVELGLDCSCFPAEREPDVVLVALSGSAHCAGADYLARITGGETHPPVIALLSADAFGALHSSLPVEDFVVEPWDASEVALRMGRALRRT